MSSRALLACAIVVLVGGCAPACGQICRKILNDCDLDSERVSYDECNTSCSSEEHLYASWHNDHLVQLFEDQRRCIGRSSCEELAAGACYDGYEELYSFDPNKVLTNTGTSAASD